MLSETLMERGYYASQYGMANRGCAEVEISSRAELRAAHRAHRRYDALADIAARTRLLGG